MNARSSSDEPRGCRRVDAIETRNLSSSPSVRRLAKVAVFVSSLCLSVLLFCGTALAYTSKSDVIFGISAEQRGIVESSLPDIEAPSAVLVDRDSTLMFERNADDRRAIASITKVMTAYVALKYGDLDSEVIVSGYAAGTMGSTAELLAGDRMPLYDCLVAMLLPSGNDAATAIAQTVGRQLEPNSESPYATFVAKMNEEAAALGMADTFYTNPHGLDVYEFDEGAYSTARDQAVLVAEAMKDERFRDIVRRDYAEIPVVGADGETRFLQLESTDLLLGAHDGAIGVKTGTTGDAGYCFVGAYTDGEREFYTVCLGDDKRELVFSDTSSLWEWGESQRVSYGLIPEETETLPVTLDGTARDAPIVAHVAHCDWPEKTVAATLSNWDEPLETYTVFGTVTQSTHFERLYGNIEVGDVVGTISFMQDGEVIATRELIALENSAAPNSIQKLAVNIGRLLRQATGRQLVAKNDIIELGGDVEVGGGYDMDRHVGTNRPVSTEVWF